MFTRLLGKSKKDESHGALTLTSLQKLTEQLDMLERQQKLLEQKAAAEREKAKAFTKANNKKAAIRCLKVKKRYEEQIEIQTNSQLRIHDQMILLEGAKATTETVGALRTGAAAMKAMQKATKIDDVDKVMDEINENMDNMKQIQEALANPIGYDFDEDELEAELEELEAAELEDDLLRPVTATSTSNSAAPVKVPAGVRQPSSASRVTEKPSAEEDELAALQAEMAL